MSCSVQSGLPKILWVFASCAFLFYPELFNDAVSFYRDSKCILKQALRFLQSFIHKEKDKHISVGPYLLAVDQTDPDPWVDEVTNVGLFAVVQHR